jgi:hypothetical protein
MIERSKLAVADQPLSASAALVDTFDEEADHLSCYGLDEASIDRKKPLIVCAQQHV